MCGLSGFSGVKDHATRAELALALGIGIDRRGGHACGYVSLDTDQSKGGARVAKKLGKFGEAKARFMFGAARGEVLMMHSRFATCGSREDTNNAHPFVISRKDATGKESTVLIGAHNGMLTGTYTSAHKHGRKHTVDSKELFELLADGKHEAIRDLEGYGVITFITPHTGHVFMAKLSEASDIVVTRLVTGGIVWASTVSILDEALKACELEREGLFTLDTIGMVYAMTSEGVWSTDTEGVHVAKSTFSKRGGYASPSWYSSAYGGDDLDSDWDDAERWDKEALDRWASNAVGTRTRVGSTTTLYEPKVSGLTERSGLMLPPPVTPPHRRTALYEHQDVWDMWVKSSKPTERFQPYLEAELARRARVKAEAAKETLRSERELFGNRTLADMSDAEVDMLTDEQLDAIILRHQEAGDAEE